MSNPSIDRALALEREFLGEGWLPLPCGCHVDVKTWFKDRLFFHAHVFGHRLHCEDHQKRGGFLRRIVAEDGLSHWLWYKPGDLVAVTQEEFEKAWDQAAAHRAPGLQWIYSDDSAYTIWRDGRVERILAQSISPGI